MDKTQKNRWDKYDFYWVIGILIAIIIIIISMWINEDIVSFNFSIASNGFTIALALVAIFITLKQDSDNQKLNNQMNTTLAKMDGKLDIVEKKVNQIDVGLMKEVLHQKVDESFTDVQYKKGDNDYTQEDLDKILNKQKDELLKDIDQMVNEMKNINNTNQGNMRVRITYKVGDEVRHGKWGIGEVTNVLPHGESTEVEVDFKDSVGKKRLLAEFAPITKL